MKDPVRINDICDFITEIGAAEEIFDCCQHTTSVCLGRIDEEAEAFNRSRTGVMCDRVSADDQIAHSMAT